MVAVKLARRREGMDRKEDCQKAVEIDEGN